MVNIKYSQSIKEFWNPEDERGICSSSDDQELLSSKMTIPDQQEVLHLPPHLQDDNNSCYESVLVMS